MALLTPVQRLHLTIVLQQHAAKHPNCGPFVPCATSGMLAIAEEILRPRMAYQETTIWHVRETDGGIGA